jgi:hypothetical protein
MSYELINDQVLKISDKIIQLPCKIMTNSRGNPYIIEIENLIIVNIYGKGMENISIEEMERNIWAFSKNGDLVWKIHPPEVKPYKCNPYTSLTIKNDMVIAGNCGGYDYEIDIKTGKVSGLNLDKRPW